MKHQYTTLGALLRLSLLFGAVGVASHWGLLPGCVSLAVALGAFQA